MSSLQGEPVKASRFLHHARHASRTEIVHAFGHFAEVKAAVLLRLLTRGKANYSTLCANKWQGQRLSLLMGLFVPAEIEIVPLGAHRPHGHAASHPVRTTPSHPLRERCQN